VSGLRFRVMGLAWSQVLALFIALAMGTLLVWFFVDLRFFVYEADVRGNALVSAADVYRASGLDTMSIFYINRDQVTEDIRRRVLGVVGVQVDCQLPSRVRLRIREQDVHFVWHTMGTTFLVDGEGRVLKVDDGAHEGFILIDDLDDRPLEAGDQVDRVALNAVSGLHSLLPEVRTFEYSRARGVSLLDARGWRIYFGDDQSLEEKVASMHAVLQKVANHGGSLKYIDVRFVGSPYYE